MPSVISRVRPSAFYLHVDVITYYLANLVDVAIQSRQEVPRLVGIKERGLLQQ